MKLLSPSRRRKCVAHVRTVLQVPEQRVCRLLEQPRATQRHRPSIASDEEPLKAVIIHFASEYGRTGIAASRLCLSGKDGW